MYTVLGASGNTGKATAEYLIEQGQQVRVIGRSEEKLQDLIDKGAKAVIAEISEVEKLTEAFKGSEAVYILSPPVYTSQTPHQTYTENAESIKSAIINSGVKHVVNLSSLGADVSDGLGPVSWLYENEQTFNSIEGVNILHLRPGYFLENFFMSIEPMINNGIFPNMMTPDFTHGFVATPDIGKIAAMRMIKRDFEGHSFFEIHGQRDITIKEVSEILAASVGKENVQYIQISGEDMAGALAEMQMHPELVEALVELNHGFLKGLASRHQPRSEESTTEMSVEFFAEKIFKHVAAG